LNLVGDEGVESHLRRPSGRRVPLWAYTRTPRGRFDEEIGRDPAIPEGLFRARVSDR
jgi:hypothetical protein